MRLLLLSPVLLALLAVGCAPRTAPPAPAGPVAGQGPDDLAAARARWEATRPADYTYTLHRNCFCMEEYRGPFVVTVERGRIAKVERAGQPVTPSEVEVPTVEELFRLLAEAYAQGAHEVRVTYDGPRGYPAELWIDRAAEMADEEIGYTLTAFRAE